MRTEHNIERVFKLLTEIATPISKISKSYKIKYVYMNAN